MIWSTYHVFGSGSGGVRTFARPHLKLSQVVAACRALAAISVIDGDNGFGGTRSVPDEMAHKLGVCRSAWFHPGPKGVKHMDGFVLLKWRTGQLEQFVAIMDVSALTLSLLDRNCRTVDAVIELLKRRAAIVSAVAAAAAETIRPIDEQLIESPSFSWDDSIYSAIKASEEFRGF